MRQIFLLLGLLICCAKSMAQVPESGRWQELHYSSNEVHLATDLRYQDQVEQLNANRQLDTHKKLIKRVLAITKGLITVAHKMKPETKDWDWKFHISNDLQTEAFCMAGGKVFVGRDFIAKLQLNDAELAVLLAHEMAHAIAEHHREELTEAWHSEIQANLPVEIMLTRLESDFSLQLRMSNLSHTQEREADQLGMLIAHRAGWPASSMVAFYHKLAKHAPANLLTNSHPSAASRLSMAKGMAQLLGD